jgi:hypothetical protein
MSVFSGLKIVYDHQHGLEYMSVVYGAVETTADSVS